MQMMPERLEKYKQVDMNHTPSLLSNKYFRKLWIKNQKRIYLHYSRELKIYRRKIHVTDFKLDKYLFEKNCLFYNIL
jgi:hypothetical protein